MKTSFLVYLVVFHFTLNALAKEKCISPEQAQMPPNEAIPIAKTKYSIGICYLAEVVKKGLFEGEHKDLIFLKRDAVLVAEARTKMNITVGRISDLTLEKTTTRFISLSYGAGEFCNGLVIFDTKLKKVSFQNSCESPSDICHVMDLNEAKCLAKIECKDRGVEGAPPTRKTPIIKNIKLCS